MMNKDTQYLCPRCGSTNWKFPNVVKPADFGFNLPEMVNNFYECRRCSYLGIFFEVDTDKVEEIQKNFQNKTPFK